MFFKIHIQLLAFANFFCRFIKDGHYFWQVQRFYFAQIFISGYKHYITCKQGGVLAVFFMYGLLPTAQRRFVHNIIMYQAKVVKKFYGSGGIKSIHISFAKQFVGHIYGGRPYSFTAETQDVLCRIIQCFGMFREMPDIKFFFKDGR